jgi:hypothetical protein
MTIDIDYEALAAPLRAMSWTELAALCGDYGAVERDDEATAGKWMVADMIIEAIVAMPGADPADSMRAYMRQREALLPRSARRELSRSIRRSKRGGKS